MGLNVNDYIKTLGSVWGFIRRPGWNMSYLINYYWREEKGEGCRHNCPRCLDLALDAPVPILYIYSNIEQKKKFCCTGKNDSCNTLYYDSLIKHIYISRYIALTLLITDIKGEAISTIGPVWKILGLWSREFLFFLSSEHNYVNKDIIY